MLPFVELDASRVRLAPGQALLRARDYQDYLSANRLVEAARERAAEIEREAHEVYQEQKRLGWEAGLEEARLRQAGLIQETLLRCNRYYRQVDRQLGEVVLQAVRKVLRHYDAVELTLAATREALALVSNQKQVILHVQPEQLAAVREQVARVLKDFPEVGYLEVVGDARLDQGGCILETEIGIIDASLDSQLAALQAALTESVARAARRKGTPVGEPGAAPARALAPGRGLRRCRSPAAATLAVRSAPSEQGEAAAFGLRRIQADEDLELARLGRVPELAVVEL